LIVGSNFICNSGGKFCGGLIAKGVGSTSPFCGVVDNRFGDPFEHVTITKPAAISGVGVNVARDVIALSGSIYQDSYVSTQSFSFPPSYGIADTIRVPGMLWQVQKEDDNDKAYWNEPEMTKPDGTITMCYPGVDVWNKATISQRGYSTASLKTGYIINT
jgi:hypothetical protein